MPQYARPSGTVVAGEWYDTEMSSQSNLHSMIDEGPTPSDTDYIQAMDADGSTTTCKFGLSNVDDPGSGANHKIAVRVQGVDGGEGIPELQFALYDLSTGPSGVGLSGVTPSDEWDNYIFTLAASGANAINSYDHLEIWLTMDPAGADFGGIFVSQAYFECPTALAATTNHPFLLFIE